MNGLPALPLRTFENGTAPVIPPRYLDRPRKTKGQVKKESPNFR
jgi:hypothetical protein